MPLKLSPGPILAVSRCEDRLEDSFDHLVSAGGYCERNGWAERLSVLLPANRVANISVDRVIGCGAPCQIRKISVSDFGIFRRSRERKRDASVSSSMTSFK